MADTVAKKEKEKKRARKKKEKLEKREDRKTHNNKGKSLEDMLIYVDEMGNLTDVPPGKQQARKKINAEDIQIGVSHQVEEEVESTGTISLFFNDKAYGFITEDVTRANIFVHSNSFMESLKEKDRVTFKKEHTPKGISAINVRKFKNV